MRRALLGAVLALAGCGSGPVAPGNNASEDRPANIADVLAEPAAQPVTLKAADGVELFGNYVEGRDPKALVLLFHQAGSGKGEYASIAPQLARSGYSSLAIDQRAGGGLFGANQTVAALGHSADYLDAKQDLEAALAWARKRHLPVLLWGSSYSASLVLLIAAEHPKDVAGVLAFSPGEYFDGKPEVRAAALRVRTPVFLTSAQDPEEIAAARALFDAVPAEGKEQFVPTLGGVHGSSTLLAAKNPKGAAQAWSAVQAFLDRVTAPAPRASEPAGNSSAQAPH